MELLAGEDGLAGFASDELLIHILLHKRTLPKVSHDNAKCQVLFKPHHTGPEKTSLFAETRSRVSQNILVFRET